MKSGRHRGAYRREPFAQNAGIDRLALRANHKAARFFVAPIPSNSFFARDLGRQVELKATS